MSRLTGSSSSRIPYVSMTVRDTGAVPEEDAGVQTDQPVAASMPSEKVCSRPKTYLWLTALSSVFCVCFGALGLWKSRQVGRLYSGESYKSSRVASKDAKAWGQAAVAFGLFWVLTIVALAVFAATEPPMCDGNP